MKNIWVLAKVFDDWVKHRIMITTITSASTTSLSFVNPQLTVDLPVLGKGNQEEELLGQKEQWRHPDGKAKSCGRHERSQKSRREVLLDDI